MDPAKHSAVGTRIVRHLAGTGQKIFTVKEAREAARELGIRDDYVIEILHHLLQEGWVIRLKRGIYAMSPEAGFGPAPHEFIIAMALVHPCAISHWTAMRYHHLTQQIPNTIFAITPAGTSVPRSLSGGPYHFVRVKKEHYFGIETIWVDEARVQITDLERTLLDGLATPQYCGDFREVLHAFKMAKTKIGIEKIIEYALQLPVSVIKRLGLILDTLGLPKKKLLPLLRVPISSYRKFDPTGPLSGPYNAKWKIQENL